MSDIICGAIFISPVNQSSVCMRPKGHTEAHEYTPASTLARQVCTLRGALERIRDGVSDGCADGSCVIRKPEGMHTNGGCRCVKQKDVQRLQLAILASRRVARVTLEDA